MLEIIEEIKACIQANLFRSALGMALTLPDICGAVEYPGEDKIGVRYVSWCENYLFNQGYLPSHDVDYNKPPEEWERIRAISPEMCYKLRCAFLHSGNLELNQRKNDAFPVFTLHISSTKENGIYVDRNMCDDESATQEVSLDVRRLVKVLCNAAEEYYENHMEKECFANHNVVIVDVEEEANDYNKAKEKHVQIQAVKRNVGDFEELSDLAKATFYRYCNGEQKTIRNELETDKELLFAINELIVAGFLTISGDEEKFE